MVDKKVDELVLSASLQVAKRYHGFLSYVQYLYGTEVCYSEIVLLFQAKCLPGKNILNCAQRVLSTVALLTLFGEGD